MFRNDPRFQALIDNYSPETQMSKASDENSELTIRDGADLGYIPVFFADACAAGDEAAASRSIEEFKFIGDRLMTGTETIRSLWHRFV